MRDIAVIIVNWNACEDLRACLKSLTGDDHIESEMKVMVVDNASSDGSAEMVATEFPAVRLIRSSENLGFSKGNNLAIAQAGDYRYVFLLNSDASIQCRSGIDCLVEFADTHPKAGIIGPKVFNPDGSLQYSCRSFPGLGAGLFRNTLLGKLFPHNKWAVRYLMTNIDHDVPRSVDWVSGCAMLIRQELIAKIGALDERFYMYCEDVDICKRAWDAGWEVWYCPALHVTHKIGASSDKNADKMIWEFHRSWEVYDIKHNPRSSSLRRWAVRTGLWLRATIRIRNRRKAERRRA